MSSFGESNKTRIEENLSWIAREYYSDNRCINRLEDPNYDDD